MPRDRIAFVQSEHGRSTPLAELEALLDASAAGDVSPRSKTRDELGYGQPRPAEAEGDGAAKAAALVATLGETLRAAQRARREEGREEVVLVCGSVYLMAEVMHALQLPVPIDDVKKV